MKRSTDLLFPFIEFGAFDPLDMQQSIKAEQTPSNHDQTSERIIPTLQVPFLHIKGFLYMSLIDSHDSI